MKKIDEVFNQLSKLYEFNKKLQTYNFPKKNTAKGQPVVRADSKKRG